MEFLEQLDTDTMLKEEMPSMIDIANAAAFLASDLGSMITRGGPSTAWPARQAR